MKIRSYFHVPIELLELYTKRQRPPALRGRYRVLAFIGGDPPTSSDHDHLMDAFTAVFELFAEPNREAGFDPSAFDDERPWDGLVELAPHFAEHERQLAPFVDDPAFGLVEVMDRPQLEKEDLAYEDDWGGWEPVLGWLAMPPMHDIEIFILAPPGEGAPIVVEPWDESSRARTEPSNRAPDEVDL